MRQSIVTEVKVSDLIERLKTVKQDAKIRIIANTDKGREPVNGSLYILGETEPYFAVDNVDQGLKRSTGARVYGEMSIRDGFILGGVKNE